MILVNDNDAFDHEKVVYLTHTHTHQSRDIRSIESAMKIVFFLPINYNGHHCRLLLMPDFFGFSLCIVHDARTSLRQ